MTAPPAGTLRVLLVAAAALVALGARAAGPGAQRPPAEPVADDAGLELRLDLNRASVADLETLPGVGPALAARIAARRDERGPYRCAAELADVRGVGPRLAAALGGLVAAD